MKNKKNIYFLLPAVLFIWGSVIYQFFSYSVDEEVTKVTSGSVNLKPLFIKERDTLSIEVSYRDPFLGTLYKKKLSEGKSKVSKNRLVKKKEPLVWPLIIYKGIVSDNKEKTQVFMLIIDGETFLMKKGDIEKNILLKEGNRENITLKYKGNLVTILMNG